MSTPVIRIEKMNKWFGNFHVLRDIDLTVTSGEKIVICGPSGSGKSTLIRCINRLEQHQEGMIEVQGTAEGHAFRRDELEQLLDLAGKGVGDLLTAQQAALES